MNAIKMKDGNILIRHHHDITSFVLAGIGKRGWPAIESQHPRGPTTQAILINPLGHDNFDDFGKKALTPNRGSYVARIKMPRLWRGLFGYRGADPSLYAFLTRLLGSIR
ncbi:hypothetical protein N8I74_07940 [Chitiniphilus purpureus]|uniref:Uncharacterized protein n=1 Tax=Chitiniphilus purpureus TaxID=2981137 RepID=A0ABY6DRD4_9NEIS|nr:hypothetical protein [Chitiniphilus sp. CD1]UXY16934.1 hypothetical protein N8I74_07940 [Chitiniphilus sp. CD1]